MGTSKIPHWELLLTFHLPLSGKLGHKGQNLHQPQLLTWQMPAGPRSVKGWAKAHFRECFWPQRWCIFSPKPAVSIYLLCFKFSRTWYIFIYKNFVWNNSWTKFPYQTNLPFTISAPCRTTEILSNWFGVHDSVVVWATQHRESLQRCNPKVLFYRRVLALLSCCSHVFLFPDNKDPRQCLMGKQCWRLPVTMK